MYGQGKAALSIIGSEVGYGRSKHFNVIYLGFGVGIGAVGYGKGYGVKSGSNIGSRGAGSGRGIAVTQIPRVGKDSAAGAQVTELHNERTAAIGIDGSELCVYLCPAVLRGKLNTENGEEGEV